MSGLTKFRNGMALFLVSFAAYALLRLYSFNRTLFKDETVWLWAASHARGIEAFLTFHPPLGITLYTAAYSVLGGAIRLMPILASLVLFVIVWRMAVKHLGEREAFAASLLSAFSYYSIVAAQTVDVDGAILALLSAAAIYAFVRFVDTKNNVFLWASGLILGLSVLTRYSNGIIILPMAYYAYVSRAKLWNVVKLGLVAAIPFALWLVIDPLVFGKSHFFESIGYYLSMGSGGLDASKQFVTAKLEYFYLLQRKLTPPLVLLLAGAFVFVRRDKFTRLLMAWVLTIFAFYALTTGGDPPRYPSVALPAVFLLVGAFAAAEIKKLKARDAGLMALAAVYAFSLLYGFNMTEWETLANFIPFTIAKYAIVVLPIAAAWLLWKDRRLLVLLLAGMSVGFTGYYLLNSTEFTQSWLAGELLSRSTVPTAVFGEYGLCTNVWPTGVPCAVVGEVNDTYLQVNDAQRAYFPLFAQEDAAKYYTIPADQLGATLREHGYRQFVISKKIVLKGAIAAPEGCAAVERINRFGEELATVYRC